MTADLREFEARNSGFQQFCNRYQFVANDPQARDEFLKWQAEIMRHEGMLEAAREEGKELSDANWQKVVDEKDAELAKKDAEIAKQDIKLVKLDAEIAKQDIN
ncbi:MAG: hypothetical protein LBT47_11270 [Deltaproteobacteria bacterium]|nr:hypothetical protein [Deltaproteobacteria bacterium]